LIITGIHEMKRKNVISVYLGQSCKRLSVAFSEDAGKQVGLNIFNTFGQRVFAQKTPDHARTTTLDISKYAEGIYFLRVTSDMQTIFGRQIIISR